MRLHTFFEGTLFGGCFILYLKKKKKLFPPPPPKKKTALLFCHVRSRPSPPTRADSPASLRLGAAPPPALPGKVLREAPGAAQAEGLLLGNPRAIYPPPKLGCFHQGCTQEVVRLWQPPVGGALSGSDSSSHSSVAFCSAKSF